MKDPKNLDSKVPNGVNQIAYHALKKKSIADFNMSQTIPYWMDELQSHIHSTFQPLNLEDDGYSGVAIPLYHHLMNHYSRMLKLNFLILSSC